MEFGKYLPKSDVVFTIMFLNKELCEKTLSVILGEKVELIDIVSEFKNDMYKAALNAIYFDIKTRAKDGRIITLDLQRKYNKSRIRNRTVYYAYREVASQKVEKSRYENLASVIVTFLLTEAGMGPTTDNSVIKLVNVKTGEQYSDLLTIHEVNIKHIGKQDKIELQILKSFFEIGGEEDYKEFIEKYGKTELGSLLWMNYISAINNKSLLEGLSEEEKYMIRLSEEDRLEERMEGRLEERKDLIINMYKNGLTIDEISKLTNLTLSEIESLIKGVN